MKNTPCIIALLFTLCLFAACSNSTSEYMDVEVSPDSSSSEATVDVPAAMLPATPAPAAAAPAAIALYTI